MKRKIPRKYRYMITVKPVKKIEYRWNRTPLGRLYMEVSG